MPNDIQSIGTLTNMWLREPNWAEDITNTFKQSINLIQYGGSVGELWVDNYESPIRGKYAFRNHTKDEEKEMLDFFEGRLGRHGCFWMPTWITGFEVIQNMQSTDLVVAVKNNDLSASIQGHERIAFILNSGDIIVRKIAQVTVVDDTRENVTLASAVDRNILIGDISMCCLFLLVRFDNDAFEFNYTTDCISNIGISVYELIREYP